jgi:hypothetical protein
MQLGFVLLFTPILAATGLSREREEKTLDLLRATTLDPRRIVWAKFAISLRLVIGLCLSVLIVPIVMLMGMDILDSNPPRADPRILSPSMPAVLPFLFVYPIFFAALSLFCSSMCRRNAASIVSSYMAMGFLIALPPLIDLTWDLLDAGSGETGGMRAVGWTRDMLLPLFSPFFYFARAEGGERPHAYESWQSPRQVIAAAGLILVMTRVIYLATVRKVAAAGEGIAWGVGRGEARERKRKLRELEGARVKWIASGIAEDEKERER